VQTCERKAVILKHWLADIVATACRWQAGGAIRRAAYLGMLTMRAEDWMLAA
jgi:hypothetical protein